MSAMPTILLAMAMPDAFVRQLARRGRVVGPMSAAFAEDVAALPAATRADVRVLVTMGTVAASDATMARLPALGLVCCLGSGYEGVDTAAARRRGIVAAHSPAANASAVADIALGLMIASIRRMFDANAFLLRGEWTGNTVRRTRPAVGLTGRRVGVYGLGAIGERVALRAEACEMEVGYHSRRQRQDVTYPYFGTLLELATWADVLVVAVRADGSNRHTVNAAVLKALGSRGHVINIARGAVIDEGALIQALTDGTIEGAGLDVFEHEPEVPAVLMALPNVALTPHIGGAAEDAQVAMQSMVLANVDAFLAGRPVPTPVPESEAAYPAVAVR